MTDDNVRYFPRLGIGEAMRLFGMTARALRFYEEKGLIEARRDRMNCRYYDPVARKRLAWIGPLRAAGLSLADIMSVIEADEADGRGHEAALGFLQTRRQAMQLELAKLDLAIEKYAAAGPALRKRS